jgi:hypothetical protein
MTRRECILGGTAASVLTSASAAADKAPVVNAAEHAWVLHDPRFRIDPEIATCTSNLPKYEYSGEHILAEMRTHKVDHVVISHVCYYGRNNRYPAHILKTYPGKFAAIGLLVGYRLYKPDDKENPGRLERLIKDDGFIGLRLSPIYDRDVVWLGLLSAMEKSGGTRRRVQHFPGAPADRPGRGHGAALSRRQRDYRPHGHDRHRAAGQRRNRSAHPFGEVPECVCADIAAQSIEN